MLDPAQLVREIYFSDKPDEQKMQEMQDVVDSNPSDEALAEDAGSRMESLAMRISARNYKKRTASDIIQEQLRNPPPLSGEMPATPSIEPPVEDESGAQETTGEPGPTSEEQPQPTSGEEADPARQSSSGSPPQTGQPPS